MTQKPLRLLIWAAVCLLVLLIVYVFIKLEMLWAPFCLVVKSILIPLIIAIFISYLLLPIIEWLHRSGLPRTLSLLIIYLLFFGGIGYGLYKGVPVLIEQLTDLSESIPRIAETYDGLLLKLHDHTDEWPDGIHSRMDRFIQRTEEFVAKTIEGTIRSIRFVFDYILIAATIPFLVFYMVKDIDLMKKTVWYLTPKSWRKRGSAFLRDVDDSLGDYIRGQLLVCFLIGLGAGVSFWFFDLPYPLILGLIIGLTNVIPYFGPVIGAVPALLIAMAVSAKAVITVVITILILQFLEGNILSPLIVGRSLKMHPVVIMLALLAGGELAGIIGMIVAVPAAAVLKVMMIHFLRMRTEH
ncbi:AI-2E family transporter [Bacillus atrophaeus]|uniref:AI-2E family transporter n=1 Tax=Bacillus atrophaeus TaxID=1452 RepID=UPI00227FB4AD|nr:AI-2E family transporter [Bacillus atrophaeus]MCY8465014.1 AI-2E family transporter [Bacillus atrophaeus]MCY8478176.1 AI-2E family transporter [Bacillus atrophaeus]MCY9135068.1 AI-2E family transporter [Bacillus atrophaeus]MED4804999.1 AI-2E family transporter [Bacillus atrophaeus]MED4813393.1 AI-2E family transporter [Bacillus atrophaeus]